MADKLYAKLNQNSQNEDSNQNRDSLNKSNKENNQNIKASIYGNNIGNDNKPKSQQCMQHINKTANSKTIMQQIACNNDSNIKEYQAYSNHCSNGVNIGLQLSKSRNYLSRIGYLHLKKQQQYYQTKKQIQKIAAQAHNSRSNYLCVSNNNNNGNDIVRKQL